MNEDVTVIIPVYNKEKYIARAIESVLRQSHDNFELLIINDGSQDKSMENIKKYSDPRIRVISQENKGVSAARNRGIKEANSKLVSFLDADDEYNKDFLKHIIELHQNYDSAGIYSTSYEVITPNGRRIIPKILNVPKHPQGGIIEDYFKTILLSYPTTSSSSAVRKEVFNDVGYFDENIRHGEDKELWFRIALKYKVAFIGYRGAVYYQNVHGRACGKRGDYSGVNKLFHTADQALINGKYSSTEKYNIREYVNRNLLGYAVNMLKDGDIRKAEDSVKRCSTKYFLIRKIVLKLWIKMAYFKGLKRVIDALFLRADKIILKILCPGI